jgi:hypothetical protein
MDYRALFDDPSVAKIIFVDMWGSVVCRFEHPEFILEVTSEA